MWERRNVAKNLTIRDFFIILQLETGIHERRQKLHELVIDRWTSVVPESTANRSKQTAKPKSSQQLKEEILSLADKIICTPEMTFFVISFVFLIDFCLCSLGRRQERADCCIRPSVLWLVNFIVSCMISLLSSM
jgi:hypothetical protein